MQTWYSTMNSSQRRTFWACFLGWVLDAMDVQFFAFVIPTLLTARHMTKAQAGVIGTSALVASAVGGVIAGVLADRIGRVRVLKLAILWFSLFTGLSAFTNGFHQLLFTRSLQGLGFGGEWAAGAILIGEVVDKRIRGRAVGCVQSGWPVGYALAALLYWVLFGALPEQYAWRVLFLLGILPGLLVLWMRRNVDESAAFESAAEFRAQSGLFDTFGRIFAPSVLPRTLLASAMAAGALGGNYDSHVARDVSARNTKPDHQPDDDVSRRQYLRLVLRLRRHGVSERCDRPTLDLLALGGGRDAHGAGLYAPASADVRAAGAGLSARTVPVGHRLRHGRVFHRAVPGADPRVGGRLLVQFGRGIGSLVPAAVGITSASVGLAKSIGVWAAASYVVVFIVAVFLPETRNKQLEGQA
jgi:MFS family permease